MTGIDGKARTVRELLSGKHYAIDYYQREYRWQPKQVYELVEDLTDKFLLDYKPSDDRGAVEKYGHYFLGSVIVSSKNGQGYLIDGQQRLTTLTLLLIYIHNRLGKIPNPDDTNPKLNDMIFSAKFGKKSFNIGVEERTPAMDALYNEQPFDPTGKSDAVHNIVGRYQDIEESFPDEIDDLAMPYFADWLTDKVHLVEITAFSDDDAYSIFETMNDRGLSLTPLEMLKGFLLSNIPDESKKSAAAQTWKQRVEALTDLGKDENTDAFKSWLRSQYAKTIRERRKGASPGDFDRLGTEFHRWLKDHDEDIGLVNQSDFVRFIQRDMDFYTRQYLRLREASRTFTPALETIYYNARHNFTLQYPLLLAPLSPDDDTQTIDRKLRVVATYLDILLTQRLWNFHSIAYSTMQYAMFLVMRDIRGKTLPDLVQTLKTRLRHEPATFANNDRLRLHQQNRSAIHQIIARLTDHVERRAGLPSQFVNYVAEGKNRYEVEHIWANHPKRHTDEFPHATDFGEYRNRIGGLLLVPKSFNASYGDMAYGEKREHYDAQNLLARSLYDKAYKNNPGFAQYIKASGLPFKAHPEFKRADLDERQSLYRRLAEEVWNPDRIDQAATS